MRTLDCPTDQWAPIAFATEEVVVAVAAPPAAVAPAAAPAAAPAPAPAAPAAPPAAPAGDKSTFTVTFKNPDGDQSFECPPDEYLLDATEELDNADDFADLPYACRAGSCSACAGKVVSGQVDTSACTFLTEDQKADGWVLTCTCKALSDVVIETHKEDDRAQPRVARALGLSLPLSRSRSHRSRPLTLAPTLALSLALALICLCPLGRSLPSPSHTPADRRMLPSPATGSVLIAQGAPARLRQPRWPEAAQGHMNMR